MPSLQLHMLRVAGVAQILMEYLQDSVALDEYSVLTACLLHDLGNITKFDFERFPQFFEPEGTAYWRDVKQKVKAEYGESPRLATAAMCRELGIPEEVIQLIAAFDFSDARKNYEGNDWTRQICAYADMRVAPHGVVTLFERLNEAQQRYRTPGKNDTHHDVMRVYLKQIENRLQEKIPVPLDSITEAMVKQRFSALRNWQLAIPE